VASGPDPETSGASPSPPKSREEDKAYQEETEMARNRLAENLGRAVELVV